MWILSLWIEFDFLKSIIKMHEKLEIEKYSALLEEFETSEKLIKLGFGELQNITLDNDFYFLPFQLLSQGFERFMKSYICLGYFYKHGKTPDYHYLKGLGHDLHKLLKEILKNYFTRMTRYQDKLDIQLLESNNELTELLYILSEFGKLARYHNFDIITDSNKPSIDPKKLWQDFENKIYPLEGDRLNKLFDFDLKHEIYQGIASKIVAVFEQFIAALSRQFIFDKFGSIGKSIISNSFFDYGLIYDGEFGQTDYRKATTRYKQTAFKTHRRTPLDEIQRRLNPNFKSKKITKQSFEGDWPFYADEVIIERRNNHWCIVTINEHDYALNGAAKGKYKLENPHDAGEAILGKSFGMFIDIALSL